MASPKAIYSFNGPLMRFVLYLPVSSNVPLDSDEAELFICSSWSWNRHTITHLRAVLPALMWTFSGRKVRNFRRRCLIMQHHMQTCWISPAVNPLLIIFFSTHTTHNSLFNSLQHFYYCAKLFDWYFIIYDTSYMHHTSFPLQTGADQIKK